MYGLLLIKMLLCGTGLYNNVQIDNYTKLRKQCINKMRRSIRKKQPSKQQQTATEILALKIQLKTSIESYDSRLNHAEVKCNSVVLEDWQRTWLSFWIFWGKIILQEIKCEQNIYSTLFCLSPSPYFGTNMSDIIEIFASGQCNKY